MVYMVRQGGAYHSRNANIGSPRCCNVAVLFTDAGCATWHTKRACGGRYTKEEATEIAARYGGRVVEEKWFVRRFSPATHDSLTGKPIAAMHVYFTSYCERFDNSFWSSRRYGRRFDTYDEARGVARRHGGRVVSVMVNV